MPPPTVPARLHVILARAAPVAVIFRRGPSKRVCTISWDRKTDRFEVGQWLNGRICPYRSDLSPDGKLMIYFAMNGKWKSKAKGSWTAISQVPYLKARGLFAKGDCWNGGGLFVSNSAFWLNDGYGHEEQLHAVGLSRASERPFTDASKYGAECPGVYFPRLMRDGWMLEASGTKNVDGARFTRALDRTWTLRKVFHAGGPDRAGRGVYWESHELVPVDGGVVARPDWEWADVDGTRVVWATRGRLFEGRPSREGTFEERELSDFNAMVFEPIAAPY